MNKGPMKYRPINQSNSEMRQKRLSDQKTVLLAIFVSLIILAIVFTTLLISLSVSSAKRRQDMINPETTPPGTDQPSVGTGEPPTESDTTTDTSAKPGDFTYTYKDFSESAMHLGPLVLINDEYAYEFGDQAGVLDFRPLRVLNASGMPIYSTATFSMYLRIDAINAMNDFIGDFYKDVSDEQYITIFTAFRTFDEQKESYEAYPEDSPMPGHSDYHSGYAFNFGPAKTQTIAVKAAELYAEFQLNQAPNAYKYGLINRYPANKTEITGNYEDHYRYVGVPHSYIMNEMDYCLEQYIEYVRMHTVNDEHIKYEIEGIGSYDIYYVPAEDGVATSVPVPEGYEYMVSGDNVGGFIVTVKTN